jgi:hypothetical protein
MLESVVDQLKQVPVSIKGELEANRFTRTVSIFRHLDTEEERDKAVAATTAYWRDHKTFELLSGWRNELYPVYGPGNRRLFSVERSASTLFGIVTYGVHMTAFVRDQNASYGLKIWVPRRSRGKQTYPGESVRSTPCLLGKAGAPAYERSSWVLRRMASESI